MDAERRERDDAGQRRRSPEGGVDRYGRGRLDPTQVALAIGATGLVVIALVLSFLDPRMLHLVDMPAAALAALAPSLRIGSSPPVDQKGWRTLVRLGREEASRTRQGG